MMHRSITWIRGLAAKILAAFCVVSLLGGCASSSSTESAVAVSSQVELVDSPLIKDNQYGGAYLDISIDEFNALGFTFGDAVDVTFSNGYAIHDIPYFNGFYAQTGQPLVCGYPGYAHVVIDNAQGPALWEQAGLSEGDTATVQLISVGKYRETQEALSLSYTSERSDYPDDVAFANFRKLSGGALREGLLYRSASPIDNTRNRPAYVNALARDAGIRFVLDLADSDEEITGFISEAQEEGTDISYFLELYGMGNMAPINLDASFMSVAYGQTLAGGLRDFSAHEGPYLIHCLEGKDRTGFVCMLLESLAGATYDEMRDDYMKTYDNYYGVTKEGDPSQYNAIESVKFVDLVKNFAHVKDDDDLKTMSYVDAARTYLHDGGMTEEEIDHLVEVICR